MTLHILKFSKEEKETSLKLDLNRYNLISIHLLLFVQHTGIVSPFFCTGISELKCATNAVTHENFQFMPSFVNKFLNFTVLIEKDQ